MKLRYALSLLFLISSASSLPIYLPAQQYTNYNRALTATCLALLLPLGYAAKQWYDVSTRDEYEQQTPELKKKKRNVKITAAVSGGLIALALFAKWNIALQPQLFTIDNPSFKQLNVTPQVNSLCWLTSLFGMKQCGHEKCGGATCGAHTCGYWAVFNAKAITDLFSTGESIDDAKIREATNQLRSNVCSQDSLEIDGVTAAARNNGLNPDTIHFLQMDHDDGVDTFVPVGPVRFESIDSDDARNKRNFYTCIRNLKNPAANLCAHFFCHVDESGSKQKLGNHWVTVSVTKRPNEAPQLFYSNSWYNNPPLASLVRFIQEKFQNGEVNR